MKREKIRKRRIKTWPVIMVLVLCCFVVLLLCLKDVYYSLKSGGASEVEIISTIENYGYTLNENDSNYVKDLFKELKKELEKDTVDEKKYAEIMSQLFIADFYSLNQAINKNDIGGVQFVYTDYQGDFIKLAKSSIYANVENNIYGTRKQELPMVNDVEVTSIEQTEYEGETISDEEAYRVELYVSYEKELEYPNHVTLIVIHKENKLQIAKMN